MPTLNRTKNALTCLFAFLFAIFLPNWVAASPANITYGMSLGQDLDGDRIPETARIRQVGDLYKISIHFTSGRPHMHLAVHQQEDEAGLSFQTADIDNDHDQDLVVTSATSVRPVAVWLNGGKAKFKRVSSWAYGGPYKSHGPQLSPRTAYTPESDVNSSTDPLAHAEKMAAQVDVGLNVELLWVWNRRPLPSDSFLRQVPARGPPLDFTL